MTGPAGMATGTVLLCPARHRHVMASVFRDYRDGTLFAPGVALDSDALCDVQCRGCGRAYTVDPVALRHAVLEGQRRYAMPR